MEAIKLAGLEPVAVWGHFEKLCSIPHGSGNTKQISDYLVSFAKEHNIRYIQDDADNVILFGEGTCGMEDHEPIILQGHLDMVCEKDADCTLDMAVDGLDIAHDGNVVFAKGTTLGADNGIAVAMGLAILADKTIPHPPVEVVITSDEEIGLLGAKVIDLSSLKGRKLINLDSRVRASSQCPVLAVAVRFCLCLWSAVPFMAPVSVWWWMACSPVTPVQRSTRTAPMPIRLWASLCAVSRKSSPSV